MKSEILAQNYLVKVVIDNIIFHVTITKSPLGTYVEKLQTNPAHKNEPWSFVNKTRKKVMRDMAKDEALKVVKEFTNASIQNQVASR